MKTPLASTAFLASLFALAGPVLASGGGVEPPTRKPAPAVDEAPDAFFSRSLSLVGEGSAAAVVAPPLELPAAPASASAPSHSAPGEEYAPNLYRRAEVALGWGAYGNFNSALQVSASGVPGVVLDMEDLLDLDTSAQVGRLDAYYRFNKRNRLDLSVYDINRSGSKVTNQDISFGNAFFPAGTGVKTSFDTLIVKLAYRYDFVADYRTTVSASFGLHVIGLDTELKGSGGFGVSESFGVDAPLPNFGLHFAYALSPKWKLYAGSESLQFDIGDYQAFFLDNRLGVEHDFTEHFGWGLGFNGSTLDGSFKDGSLKGDIEYAYQGLLVYLRAYL